MADNPTGTQPVKSAARALDILEDLAAHGPASLHVLAKRMGLPKSSLHALLRTMQGRGWIETDPTGTVYSLGIHALLVGSAYLDGDLVVARTAPLLDELARATGETVHLARLEGSHVVYTAKRESVHPLRMFSAVGRRLPVYSTALGRAILAQMEDEQARSMLPPVLEPVTQYTTTDPERVIGLLAEVRRDGYALEHEESCLGLACIAVALPFTQPGRYAISISVPLVRLDEEAQKNIVEQLLAARQSLEQPFSRKS
ncbi:DNA-binding IclR family transcriptional regulator [Thermocatellispora tengchongensis]|uniref:Glycerol operon regulatory protein n=1 Tax=Thermocatellispora tengchongensis TaxID=1073253 RepID=A0A840PFB1_9ACTN|nr:IclR family transcriptional regulator [Thermocatellispora tengchongensis]MBB5137456.1 DNA-binding IclR family transcriptional regulator [Thermocatellispora tengchongensis]